MHIRAALRLAVLAAVAGILWMPAAAGALQTDRFGAEPYPLVVDGGVRRSFSISVAPGATVEQELRIWNRSDEALTLDVYGADATKSPDGYQIGAGGSGPKDAGAWIDVGSGRVHLEPGAEQVVRFSVRAPHRMPEQALAALVVEGPGISDNAELDLRTRLAHLVEIRRSSPFPLSAMLVIAAILAVLAAAAAERERRRRRRRAQRLPDASVAAVPEPASLGSR